MQQTVQPTDEQAPATRQGGRLRAVLLFALALIGIGAVYFALAKLGLMLASIHPSATPIWPPTGIAIAAVLVWGYRIAPAIFVAALLANITTAGTLETSLSIAGGNMLEALLAGILLNRYAQGRYCFDTPTDIVRFAVLILPATAVSATIGVATLTIAGFASAANFASIWVTWWLGDVAGAVVFAPLVVFWTRPADPMLDGSSTRRLALLVGAAAAIGVVAFSPLIEQTSGRASLGFLAVLPLLWAALRGDQRDTATVALVLSAFAVGGALLGGGPFVQPNLNDSFLLLLMFMVSTTLPSLALSADATARRRSEQELRRTQEDLDQRVRLRTAELSASNRALETEIEQKKRTETELDEQRMQLTEAQRMANLGSWIWDIATNRVSWSAQLHAIYGVKQGEFAGTIEDFVGRIHPDDRERVAATISQALAAKQSFQLEERIVLSSGEIRSLRSSGEVIVNERSEPVRMLGICQDVTDRERAASALRETEERYRLMVDSVHDYAIFMLDHDGHVVSWNAGAARIKQYSALEIVGKHFRQFYTEQDRAQGEPERALRIAANEGKYATEGWRLRRDGSLFWASTVLAAIRDDKAELIGFVKVTRDNTERRDAQLALEQAREQLAQANKMEALGQLTGGIAHDFNNLLMIVSGHAQLLRQRLTEPKDLKALDAVKTAVSRGEALTRQLLGFSRRQPLNPVVVDIGEQVRVVREMLGSSLRANIELSYDLPPGNWPVEIDLAEFELALVNVVVNARDALPNGGSIVVSVRNAMLPADAAVDDLEGEFVALTVRDNGTGIPAEVMPKVFEPFFTTKPVGKGTGLGLSQVYGFARRSGGAVTIGSASGEGTTVAIYLPRTHKALPAKPRANDEQADAAVSGTILVVEDNRAVAEIASTLLEQIGYQVRLAETATEAFDQLGAGEIDLVFSDVVMPGEMNGIALAREIGTRFPQIPVLLTTGYAEMAQAAEIEFVRILRKPYQATDLARAVQEALNNRADA